MIVTSKTPGETNTGDELETSNSKLFNTGNPTTDSKKRGGDPSRFTPIEKYKPSGKLVYNPELFNAVSDKIV